MSLFGKVFGKTAPEGAHLALSDLEQGTMPSVPLTVSDADLREVVAQFPLVVVDCWASWCMPCRMLGPIIEELAEDLEGKVVFGKLNVDDHVDTAREYGIRSIPTLLVFQNGKLIDQLVGALPKEVLKKRLQEYDEESD